MPLNVDIFNKLIQPSVPDYSTCSVTLTADLQPYALSTSVSGAISAVNTRITGLSSTVNTTISSLSSTVNIAISGLNIKVDGLSATVDTKFLPLTGGVLTGNLTLSSQDGVAKSLILFNPIGESVTLSAARVFQAFTGDEFGLSIPRLLITQGRFDLDPDTIFTRAEFRVSNPNAQFNIYNKDTARYYMRINPNTAFMEGSGTSATGLASHTEGVNTSATNLASHAEGNLTIASGLFSHAQGSRTKAIGDYSFTAGRRAVAKDNYSYVWATEPTPSTAEVSSTRIAQYLVSASGGMFIPGSVGIGTDSIANALTVYGNVSGNNLRTSFNIGQSQSDYSFAEGSGITFGQYSHAEGQNTQASGFASHAEGKNSSAQQEASHAEGIATLASGQYSHAEGANTIASGSQSHAEGNLSIASNFASHAEGNTTLATGNTCHAEGSGTVAAGDLSHTEGCNTATGQRITFASYTAATRVFTFTPDTSANFNFVVPNTVLGGYKGSVNSGNFFTFRVENRSTINGSITATQDVIGSDISGGSLINNSGIYSHAEGLFSVASGRASHAEGEVNIASGPGSHAEGGGTTAVGGYSHAEGGATIASGGFSHAEGGDTRAIGGYSHAEGQNTIAFGDFSHAAGIRATAAQNYTYAWSDANLGTLTERVSTTKSGQYMVSASGGMFIPGNVGIGTDNNSNPLTVVGTISATGTVFSSGAPVIVSTSTFETPTTGISAVGNIIALSQATYNSLVVKRPDTFYIIV